MEPDVALCGQIARTHCEPKGKNSRRGRQVRSRRQAVARQRDREVGLVVEVAG